MGRVKGDCGESVEDMKNKLKSEEVFMRTGRTVVDC
jgi:hypothetical protein